MLRFGEYSAYGSTDITEDVRGIYKPIDIPFDNSDFYFLITERYVNRPGLLSKELYDTPRLGWIFAYFNKELINDPIFDLKQGLSIRIPTKERLMQYF